MNFKMLNSSFFSVNKITIIRFLKPHVKLKTLLLKCMLVSVFKRSQLIFSFTVFMLSNLCIFFLKRYSFTRK